MKIYVTPPLIPLVEYLKRFPSSSLHLQVIYVTLPHSSRRFFSLVFPFKELTSEPWFLTNCGTAWHRICRDIQIPSPFCVFFPLLGVTNFFFELALLGHGWMVWLQQLTISFKKTQLERNLIVFVRVHACQRVYMLTCICATPQDQAMPDYWISRGRGEGGFDRSRDGGKGDVDLPYYVFVNERIGSLFSGLCVTRLGLVFKVNGTV